ncbi:MAG TPA: hypothetical protein VHG29_09655 [Novosphingobium sp.]|nr:hypothetical protein [Novosphingobium sp.]
MTEGELFDTAFLRRAPTLGIRPETLADEQFLTELQIACSPLAALMPRAMLEFQARAQLASHCQQHPDAMRRIVFHEATPIARFTIDWNIPGGSHGVDIAVLPQARATLAGPHMLKAWLEVADRLHRSCSLDVLASNRAKLLYRRLGFVVTGEDDPAAPVLFMTRPSLS